MANDASDCGLEWRWFDGFSDAGPRRVLGILRAPPRRQGTAPSAWSAHLLRRSRKAIALERRSSRQEWPTEAMRHELGRRRPVGFSRGLDKRHLVSASRCP